MPLTTLRVATAHISPVLLDTQATLQKTLKCIEHASSNNASLICFPESSIPGFPIWSALLPPSHPLTHTFFAKFVEQSIYADGSEINTIRQAARQHNISVSIGFSEKARHSQATLWNSNIIIDERGEVKVHHRKLVPTFYERLSWGNGDGYGLRTTDIAVRPLDSTTSQDNSSEVSTVKIGTLICGENTNPLARYAIMSQGQNIHISTWPAIWPTHMPTPPPPTPPHAQSSPSTSSPNTTNQREKRKDKNYDNILANRLRAGAHCFEAKCFGTMCAAFLSEENIDTLTSLLPSSDSALKESIIYALRNTSQAASMFLDPTGTPVSAFTITNKPNADSSGETERTEKEMLRDQEGILFADLDLQETIEGKQYHDVVGGYQRFDVFEVSVDRRRREVVNFW